MAKDGIFQGLRQRRRAICLALAYALLMNGLLTIGFSVRVVAATLDPLVAAPSCDGTGLGGGTDPNGSSQHLPDCTLCGPACPMMGGMLQAPSAAVPAIAAAPASYVLDAEAPRRSHFSAPSLYPSDTFAQAPPAIG